MGKKIGLVKPTFTGAAYGKGAFYAFYAKYFEQVLHKNGTYSGPDTAMLTARVDPNYQGYNYLIYRILIPKLMGEAGVSTVQLIKDEDIHYGRAPASAYDILFLFHNEYMTQEEYNNLKRFVSDGGTLVCMDGNAFYVEVTYNPLSLPMPTITFVSGHAYQFDGHVVKTGPAERWAAETAAWKGSNWETSTAKITSPLPVTFTNLPFHYLYGEDDYITNPGDGSLRIIHDYGAKVIAPGRQDRKIACYLKMYGKGKIIHFGVYTDNVIQQDDFQTFFTHVFRQFVIGAVMPTAVYMPTKMPPKMMPPTAVVPEHHPPPGHHAVTPPAPVVMMSPPKPEMSMDMPAMMMPTMQPATTDYSQFLLPGILIGGGIILIYIVSR